MPATMRIQELFAGGRKALFAMNAWYESPDNLTTGRNRVWEYWQLRPTRRIERVCDGKNSSGCTWTELDGRRGVSYVRTDRDSRASFLREVGESADWAKLGGIGSSTLKPYYSTLNAVKGAFNFMESYLEVYEKRDELQPRLGLAEPKTRRAVDVVKYLFEEALPTKDRAKRFAAEFSDSAVVEDLTRPDEAWPRGREAIRKHVEEMYENVSPDFRFVLDEISDGDRACTALWHVEGLILGQKAPRGVSFYELDSAGKVCYARISYDMSF